MPDLGEPVYTNVASPAVPREEHVYAEVDNPSLPRDQPAPPAASAPQATSSVPAASEAESAVSPIDTADGNIGSRRKYRSLFEYRMREMQKFLAMVQDYEGHSRLHQMREALQKFDTLFKMIRPSSRYRRLSALAVDFFDILDKSMEQVTFFTTICGKCDSIVITETDSDSDEETIKFTQSIRLKDI